MPGQVPGHEFFVCVCLRMGWVRVLVRDNVPTRHGYEEDRALGSSPVEWVLGT